MCPTSSKNLTVHMHNFTYVLMMLIFLLAKVSANDFNKSKEAKALLATNWWGARNASSDYCTWPYIYCNKEGSVMWIYFYSDDNEGLGDLGSLDFASFANLEELHIQNCKLEGSIPEQIGLRSNLTHLSLSGNQLTGTLPFSFANLTRLEYLDLSYNNFSGILPTQVVSLQNLYYLDLSRNNFIGQIPSSFGSMVVYLSELDLSSNQLNGSIPPTLITPYLTTLDLSNNNLDGQIPLSFSDPCLLVHLDLSGNQMTGAISSVRDCLKLTYLDISGNHFVGKALKYDEFPNLRFLNQSQNHLKQRKQLFPILAVFLPIIIGLCFLMVMYFFYSRKKGTTNKIQHEITKHGDICSILNYDGTIAYEDFIKATEGFDLKYCIGTGGYGSVYEAKLPSGKTFALKKLHRYEAKQPAFDQSFKNEVQVLTNLRHKNIVRLYGFCLHNKCNFLVYEYMEKGSLFCALSNDDLAIKLDWMKRVNIIKDVAHALAYMHHDCNPPIVHRDISSNNILLNSELEGFVADFGAARLLDPDSYIQPNSHRRNSGIHCSRTCI